MLLKGICYTAFFTVLFLLLAAFLGTFLARVYAGERHILSRPLGWLERLTYRVAGVNPHEEMHWATYAKSLVLINVIGLVVLFLLQCWQSVLPLNPQHVPDVPWLLSLNTAISFVTNTNWQAYSGESTLSYATQMCGLAVQNFLSATTGSAALVALIRGFTRKNSETIGNVWADLVRFTVYVLLPLSFIFAIFLVHQGTVQTLAPYSEVQTLEGAKQTIPLGPAASQIAIKQLGTNGGGFFGVNSAHPFENPTPLTNLFEMLAILLIPAALVYMYGELLGDKRHSRILIATMLILWLVGVSVASWSEWRTGPLFGDKPILEGQETRFGVTNSLLWATATTATANGSVNCMHDSLAPFAGGVLMFNLMMGELVFGGVGVGLCSMIFFVLLTIFLSGLMVGRTPEYLGKKIEKREMQWVMVGILVPSALILVGAAIGCVLPCSLSSLGNTGPHGLSEILYAFASCAANNGSAFGGLNANTNFYEGSLSVVMLLARGAVLIPSLAIGGTLAKKVKAAPSSGTFATDTLTFMAWLVAVIVIVGALTFFPALCLGPIVEQWLLFKGRLF